ncbi:MAG: N-6 DNA methylase [Kiritimatiellae bacterium]|nr:N-6 DNA methylase [Kiritimatiellia bacterium]MBQ6245329.1 N-6 DNA methylase [Kiritimatiellia bacterium]
MARPRKSASAPAAATNDAAAAFKAIDNLLWKPGSGCSGALDYMEQSSWLLFLRYVDAREDERRMEAEMAGRPYEPILPEYLRWGSWAWPAKPDGSLDADRALAGDDLLEFVKNTLFPSLRRFKENATGTDSVHYVIGSIFEQLSCKFVNGYLLREVIALMQPLRFQTEAERHEMSVLYEERLGAMGNAGRDGGQYYTPRALIRVMIRILDPKVGETFDDGACGSGGFLCEAFRHMRDAARDNPDAWRILQKETFTGGEVKPLAYVTAQMNCILHGLETPRISFGDTLAARVADFSERDRVDVIGANPPFGAGADAASVANFAIPSSETALLFLQYFIAKLKRGGRAAIIIKNTFLSNSDNASVAVRRLLLEKCRLRWVLDLPQKVFVAGVRAVVLFFSKDGPTADPIRFYQFEPAGITLGKRRPLLESDLAEFESLVRGGGDPAACKAAWTVDPATLDPATLDLSVKNPNVVEERLPTAAERLVAIRETFAALGRELEGWK